MAPGHEIRLAPAVGGISVKRCQQIVHQRVAALVQRVAAFAGAIARLQAGPGAVMKAAILAQRFACGAGEAAEDTGRAYGHECTPVIGGILRAERGVKRVGVGQVKKAHSPNLPDSPLL